MELSKLLEYQKADVKLHNVIVEMHKDKSYQAMKKYREQFEQATVKNDEIEVLANKALASYESALAYYESNAKEIEKLIAKLSSDDLSDEEEDALVEELEQKKSAITEQLKKVNDLKANADRLFASYRENGANAKLAKENHQKAKTAYEKFKAENMPKRDEAEKARDALRDGVDPALMEKYEKLTAEGKYPAFVPAMSPDNGKTYNCGACGMSQSGVTISEINDKGIAYCESCHRIIYKY